jgi:hypothetical protein
VLGVGIAGGMTLGAKEIAARAQPVVQDRLQRS